MEFSFNVNLLLSPEGVTIVDKDFRCNGTIPHNKLNDLRTIVDRMGEASSKAQDLRTVITTAQKLRLSDHKLYLLTDSEGHGGHGVVIGLLKMGRKRLFVYDSTRQQREVEPLCVLDFYVHESRQRQGCGHRLFEAMLAAEGVVAEKLAIDRPSPKFLAFLNKYYNLSHPLPQVNNFVIFPAFFYTVKAEQMKRNKNSRWIESHSVQSSPQVSPIKHPFSAPVLKVDSLPDIRPHNIQIESSNPGRIASTYSRHGVTTLVSQEKPLEPPIIKRDGPSPDYQQLFSQPINVHHRNTRHRLFDTNLNIFGVPSRQTFVKPLNRR